MYQYRIRVGGNLVITPVTSPLRDEDAALRVAAAWKTPDLDVRIEKLRLNDDGTVPPMGKWQPYGL